MKRAYALLREHEEEIFTDFHPMFDCVKFHLDDISDYVCECVAEELGKKPIELSANMIYYPNHLECDIWYGVYEREHPEECCASWQVLKYEEVE